MRLNPTWLLLTAFLTMHINCIRAEENEGGGGGLSAEEAEQYEECCDDGKYKAIDGHCNFDEGELKNEKCTEIAAKCCTEQISDKNEKCLAGIDQARKDRQCESLENDDSKYCCQYCIFGLSLAKTGCQEPSNEYDAENVCCKYAHEEFKASETTTAPSTTTSTTTTTKRAPASDLDGCELEGSQTCAHKCVPNGKSYKCQCRPGFDLRSDGVSCQKKLSELCKKSNPCLHKCNDDGEKIVCSCHKGYEIMSDGFSCIDINECDLQTHTCPSGKTCKNTQGSYRCVVEGRTNCPVGYQLNRENQVCDDINECLSNPCGAGRSCSNTLGSYTCFAGEHDDQIAAECPPGFRLNSESDCSDIDECLESTHDCNNKSQICLNTPGSYFCQNRASKTTCPAGYKMITGTGCIDIDECTEVQDLCPATEVCINQQGGYDCKTKTSARRKEDAPPKVQTPVPNPVPPSSRPQVTKPCPKGYKRSYNGGCTDINECTEGLHTCDIYQDCSNTLGSFRCICKRGFKKDLVTGSCIDINECQKPDLNNCVRGQRCDNTIGSFHCVRQMGCGTGYTWNAASEVCEDDDECALNQHNCYLLGPNYECVNQRGSFKCVKKVTTTTPPPQLSEEEYYYEEYEDNSTAPEQNTTPPRPTIPLEPPRAEPSRAYPSLPPSYPSQPTYPSRPTYPSQPSAYPSQPTYPTYSTRTSPNDVSKSGNEEDDVGRTVPPEATFPSSPHTPNTPGVTRLIPLEKRCLPGYEMNAKGECVDIDECTTRKTFCDSNTEVCQNTPGEYICICAPGYLKNQRTGQCEREQRPDFPKKPTWQPRPLITCNIGYRLNSETKTCEDINECAENLNNCARDEVCVNSAGGYKCQCQDGFHLELGRCVSDRPKVFTPPPPRVQPRPTPSIIRYNTVTPTVRIFCDRGYRPNDKGGCSDIDECSTGQHSCRSNQICINAIGGYVCTCPAGHAFVDNECRDINECNNPKACPYYSTCENTVGSYKCNCHAGFVSSPTQQPNCIDYNECNENDGRGPCQTKCINIFGSYRCDCDPGFRLESDNRTCTDFDECALGGTRLCYGICRNTPGSYQCACPAGYTLGKDGRSCNDIDECETGALVCGADQICQNTRGGARCNSVACPPGYAKEPQSNSRCRLMVKCRINDEECLRRPDTYSYNFLTFVSNLPLPTGPVDLFTMRGPQIPGAIMRFEMRFMGARAAVPGVQTADASCFRLKPLARQASISLVKSLTGPQDIELELAMDLYQGGYFQGTAVAKLYIFVSEFDF